MPKTFVQRRNMSFREARQAACLTMAQLAAEVNRLRLPSFSVMRDEIRALETMDVGGPELRIAVAKILLLRHCRRCGCIDNVACDGGCEWVENDLCSACA